MFSLRTSSVDETRSLAAALAPVLRDGDLVLLSGDLGAGKTAFVQGLGRGLLVADRVTSPTFTIMQHYEGRLTLHHVDAYRLESAGEVFELALPEVLDDGGVMVVEWGERVRGEVDREYLELTLTFGTDDDERRIEVSVTGPSWVERNPRIQQALSHWTAGA
ncbi:MAG: tRNA (adenosine(37)-N6)-threonylcarbamoyltransferase complex ATPase subunit type 1 TsaE [Actinomycetota bacterium]